MSDVTVVVLTKNEEKKYSCCCAECQEGSSRGGDC